LRIHQQCAAPCYGVRACSALTDTVRTATVKKTGRLAAARNLSLTWLISLGKSLKLPTKRHPQFEKLKWRLALSFARPKVVCLFMVEVQPTHKYKSPWVLSNGYGLIGIRLAEAKKVNPHFKPAPREKWKAPVFGGVLHPCLGCYSGWWMHGGRRPTSPISLFGLVSLLCCRALGLNTPVFRFQCWKLAKGLLRPRALQHRRETRPNKLIGLVGLLPPCIHHPL